MGWSVARYMARIRVLLEDGIAARSFGGSHARSLLVGIFALIVGSFVW